MPPRHFSPFTRPLKWARPAAGAIPRPWTILNNTPLRNRRGAYLRGIFRPNSKAARRMPPLAKSRKPISGASAHAPTHLVSRLLPLLCPPRRPQHKKPRHAQSGAPIPGPPVLVRRAAYGCCSVRLEISPTSARRGRVALLDGEPLFALLACPLLLPSRRSPSPHRLHPRHAQSGAPVPFHPVRRNGSIPSAFLPCSFA